MISWTLWLSCCGDSGFCYVPLVSIDFCLVVLAGSLLDLTLIANCISWVAQSQSDCLESTLCMHGSGVSQRYGQSLDIEFEAPHLWLSLFWVSPSFSSSWSHPGFCFSKPVRLWVSFGVYLLLWYTLGLALRQRPYIKLLNIVPFF